MKKKDFDKNFMQMVADDLQQFASSGTLDKPMVQQCYNDTTDSMHKDGQITDKQRFNWCTPKQALNLNYLKKLS